MRPAGNHIDCLDLIPAYFKFNHLSGINIALLNQTVTVDNDELFPFAVMPVLTFGDAGFSDIDAHLTPHILTYFYAEITISFFHIKIGMIFYFTELHERSEVVIIDADRS